jgi:hypothetical protein
MHKKKNKILELEKLNIVTQEKCSLIYFLFCYLFSFCLFFFGAGIEPRASRMLGKRCTTKVHPSLNVA